LWDVNPSASQQLGFFDLTDKDEVQVRGLAWSHDGAMLAVTDYRKSDGCISILDPWHGKVQSQVKYSRSYCNDPCWSPDGRIILVPGNDSVINVYAGDDLT